MRFSDLKWSLLIRHGGMVIAAAFVAGVVFVWTGFYNVSASSDHWVITTWILERVRENSISTWSYFVDDPPALDDPDFIRLGAGHYEGGCAVCHSRPGEPIDVIIDQMLPPPPLLAHSIAERTPEELFWIVKHGLKYTAMPAWPAQERDDEVWMLVAFVRQLPEMTADEYARLASGNADTEIEEAPGDPALMTECSRCHGTGSEPPTSSLIPRLAGQSQAYLERALREYATGGRPSGIMRPVAFELDAEAIGRLARYYSALPELPASPSDEVLSSQAIANGREIAASGVPEDGIPPCLACHSGATGSFPKLAGQSAAYLAGQLALWQHGARDETTYGAIMATIARRLSAQQIHDVTIYFQSLRPGHATRSGTTGEAAQ